MCVQVSSTLVLASRPDVVVYVVAELLMLLAWWWLLLLLLACTDARRLRSGGDAGSRTDEAALAWKRCSSEIRRWLRTDAGLSANDNSTLSVEPLSEELGDDSEDADDLSEAGEARCLLRSFSTC